MKKKKDKTEGPQGIFGTTESPDGNIPSEGGKTSRGSGKKEKALSAAGKIIWGIFVLVTLFNTIYFLQEDEYGVIRTLGNTQIVETPGMKFKIPYFQQVIKVSKAAKQFSVGYDLESDVSVEGESFMITSDYNFVNVDFYIEYKVSDPVKAVYASKDPVHILQNISKSCVRTVIGSYDVDSVLTTGKNEIQSKVKDMIIAQLDRHDVGLQVVNVTIQDSEPPTAEVMEAFKAVETAKQGKETAINNANKYRNEKLPGAKAQIDKIMQEAEAEKTRRVNEANGEVAKFNAMYEEYVKNPQVTKQRMFYEAMEEVLPGLKVVIDGTNQMDTILPLDSFVAAQAPAAQAQDGREDPGHPGEEARQAADQEPEEGGEE